MVFMNTMTMVSVDTMGEHPKAEDDVTEQCYSSWNSQSCQDADNQNWYRWKQTNQNRRG